MLQNSPRRSSHRASWLVRRRFQLLVALILASSLPVLARAILAPSSLWFVGTWNAYLANIVAVVIAFWLRLSFAPYPGIRSSYVILPTAGAAHAAVLAFFFFTRLPYDRLSSLLDFIVHVSWFYVIYFLVQRRVRLRIAVVPLGKVSRLSSIDSVSWMHLSHPNADFLKGCDAVVADFTADMPPEWEKFLADAALAGTIVYQVKPLLESMTGRVEIDHLSENNFGFLVPARGYFYFKAVLDWLFALIMLPVLSPVLALAAIAVALGDKGPVLFRQTRIGHRGHPFQVYKFRTMRLAESPSDARAAAMTGNLDPRITRVGSFLRKSRIDELPQLFNILKNEMSWIGPRPEADVLSQWYAVELPFYPYRHVVKPGISGWAQVNQGHVVEVGDVHEKLHYDFYYIKYFSPWLDLLILFKTIKTMVTGFGSK